MQDSLTIKSYKPKTLPNFQKREKHSEKIFVGKRKITDAYSFAFFFGGGGDPTKPIVLEYWEWAHSNGNELIVPFLNY